VFFSIHSLTDGFRSTSLSHGLDSTQRPMQHLNQVRAGRWCSCASGLNRFQCGILCCGACSRGALDLPGYDMGEERVCEVCRKRVLALRTFLNKNQETLISNVHVNRGQRGRQKRRMDAWFG
jgi:hypothetical protein